MAILGLRVNQGPTLNLSDIFKSATVDPDTVVKMELAKSQILGQQHQNLLYDQQTELARQSAAKTAQEQADLKARAEYGDQAGIAAGEDLASKYPMPVAVQPNVLGGNRGGGNLLPPGTLENRPAIVSTEAQHSYDTGVAAARALAKVYARSGGSPAEIAKAIQMQYGTDVASAALTPGGPAAVGVTPDQMRIGGMLATGNAPTTTTMITSEDTAPAVNAVREAAGKLPYDIALEREKADAKAKADLAANPFGTAGAGPAAAIVSALRAEKAQLEAQGQTLSPEKQQRLEVAETMLAKETTVPLGKDATMQTYNYTTRKWESTGGAAAAAPGSIYAKGTGNDQIENQHLDEISAQIATDPNFRPTAIQMQDYETAYANQYLKARLTAGVDASQRPLSQKTYGYKPANILTPAQVRARYEGRPIPALAGRPPPSLPPTARPPATVAEGSDPSGLVFQGTGFQPPTGPASVDDPNSPDFIPQGQTVNDVIGGAKPPPLTADQSRASQIIPFMAEAHKNMRETPVANLPNSFFAALANPENPGVIAQVIEQQVAPEDRQYAQEAAQFSLYLYQLSGAAFPGGEYPRNLRTFIPVAADNSAERRNKLQAQVHAINRLVNIAFHDDPDYRHQAQRDALARYGLRLDDSLFAPELSQSEVGGGPPTAGGAPASGGPPAAGGAPSKSTAPTGVPQSLWDAMGAQPGKQETYLKNLKLMNTR